MKVFTFDQYSPGWWAARRGIPTASEFANIITPKTMKPAAAADAYIHRLIGDQYDPEYPRIDRAVNDAMREGTRREPESRRWYRMERQAEVTQVGFALSDCGRFGCSPDGLVGDDGAIELKNPSPSTQVKYLIEDTLPDEYRAQVHGTLLVTGRQWVDFLSYCPGLPPLLKRVTPDEFTAKLRTALEQFLARLEEVRQQIERRAA